MNLVRSLTLIGLFGCLTGCMSTTAEPTSVPSTPTLAAIATPTVGEVPQRLAFVANQPNAVTIMLAALDGSPAQVLNPDFPMALDPSWSPDGNELAFAVQDSDGFNIYISAADGSNLVQVTTEAGDDQHPSWSPDGQQLVFQSNRSGNDEIYRVNRDGGNVLQLTNDPAQDWMPSWSPDGSLIAFSSSRGFNNEESAGRELYLIQPDGKGLQQLTKARGRAQSPAWSPDSQQLAYVFFDSAMVGGDVASNTIYTIKRDGSEPTLLQDNAFNPQWLDQRIAVTTYDLNTYHTALRILDMNTLQVSVPISMAELDLMQPVFNR